MATPESENNAASSSRTDSIWQRTVEGRWLTMRIFMRYWLYFLIGIALVMIYISARYSQQHSMEEIRALTNRLEVVRTESFRVRGEYMSRIRESSMRHTLDSLGIPLSVQIQPPYHIPYNPQK
jgi:hypothetical protein